MGAQSNLLAGLARYVIVWHLLPALCLGLPRLGRNHETSSYVIIIDAGSTGSRAHVYYYTPRKTGANDSSSELDGMITAAPLSIPTEVDLAPYGQHTVRPGLSAVPSENVSIYLEPLLDTVYHALRPLTGSTHRVPIYLGATAGMRGLDESVCTKIMTEVRATLRNSHFYFKRDAQARVLAGEEEGGFAWLSLNHEYANISHVANVTVGLLDMGGQSAQVAFIPHQFSIMAGFFAMHFNADTGPIHLYTHSFMKFGYASAFQDASQFMMSNPDITELEHPCLPKGIAWNTTPGEFGVSTSSAAVRTNGTLRLVGNPDFGKCQEVARKYLEHFKAPCLQEPCSLVGTYQPSTHETTFVLNSEFGRAFSQLGIKVEKGVAPLALLKNRTQDFCMLQKADQEVFLQSKAPMHYLHELACWLGVWAHTLIEHGWQIKDSSDNIRLVEEGVDWPLGQAIYEVNLFPYEVVINGEGYPEALWVRLMAQTPSESLRSSLSVQYLSLFLAVAVGACFGSTCQAMRQKRDWPGPQDTFRTPLLSA